MADEKTAARPKAGTYPTFTSRKKATTVLFQKPVYGVDEFKVRRLVSDKVTLTLQANQEFDVYKEIYGENGKFNAYLRKLVDTGYLCKGETVKLDPAKLQEFLAAQVDAQTNSVILWKDRPRSDAEKRLEEALSKKDEVIKAKDVEIDRLKALFEGGKK